MCLCWVAIMPDAKTKPTGARVQDYIASRANEAQKADCKVLMAMLRRITSQRPTMWGPSIVGYGAYQYTYASGRSGTACLVGFAIRGRRFVIYLAPSWAGATDLLARLGRHTMGKGCLYFARLADLDQNVLEQLIIGSVTEIERRHGASASRA